MSASADRPALRRARPGTDRRVLLTGATGVVGHAVLPRLERTDVTCLVHRRALTRRGVEAVHGNLAAPRLGLDRGTYARLAAQVDVIVHSGAVTEFRHHDGRLEATNIGGTERVLELARDAGARLVHVSTAYLHAAPADGPTATSTRYAASKLAAEEAVRASGVPYAIIRPSIVVGESGTGAIGAFQGLHLVAGAVIDGLVPVAPFDPSWRLDFVPVDLVADAIAAAAGGRLEGDLWVTAGRRALSLGAAMTVVERFSGELGADIAPVRFVPPDLFERLFVPVFLDAVPPATRATILKLLEFFGAYLAVDEPLPSDLDRICPAVGRPVPDLDDVLITTLRYWASATGRVPAACEVA